MSENPVTKQYLNSYPKSATYRSNTTAESLLDTMNFYHESEDLNEISDALFVCFYAHEAENSSHKESFAIFLTYYSVIDRCVKTCFLGRSVQHKSWTLKLFFDAKQIILERVLFSVLDGTNAMSGKEGGLQRRIRH